MCNRSPIKDYLGQDLYEGDVITHLRTKEVGKVVFNPKGETLNAAWRVKYYDKKRTRALSVQVGNRGQAVKFSLTVFYKSKAPR